jgi:hypothetical protein
MTRFDPPRRVLPRPVLSVPRLDPLADYIVRSIGPAFVRFALKLEGTDFVHGERLVKAYADFEAGRSRLLLAFRHPYGDEPQILSRALSGALPREARRLGLAPPADPRAIFVHGYEVSLWSGPFVRWLLPRTGAIPVHHARLDPAGIGAIRKAFAEGPLPLAIAPEGQASYQSESAPRIEPGTMRLARWCAQDLERSGRAASVAVLPLSIHYRFEENEEKLDAFISRVEGRVDPGHRPLHPVPSTPQRLTALFDRILGVAERHYGIGNRSAAGSADGTGREALLSRRDALIETALRRGEAVFGLRAAGDPIDRVYRIRNEGWDRIYPPGTLPRRGGLERALADRKAGEAWHAMRHMELVDILWYIDPGYWEEDPRFDRLAESARNLADILSRLEGGTIADRPEALKKRATVIAGTPIRVTAGEAPDGDALARAFRECMEEYADGRK